MYRVCDQPVSSFGVVCFRRRRGADAGAGAGAGAASSPLEYLLVQRKDSLAYVEFIRGKYNINNMDYIRQIVSNMTVAERERLVTCVNFDELWTGFWQSEHTRNFAREYEQSRTRFAALRRGYLVRVGRLMVAFSLAAALEQTNAHVYEETEFGFPKGRRNINESDVNCACREFTEETGLDAGKFELIPNLMPFEETFTGSNHVRYRHTYFVAEYVGADVDALPSNRTVPTSRDNPGQMREIRATGWFDAAGVLARIRPHYRERRDLFLQIDALLQKSLFNVCANVDGDEGDDGDADVRLVRRFASSMHSRECT
jgi:8-oxo-dGTP pyrophosphatase MutT (NUDIX family)